MRPLSSGNVQAEAGHAASRLEGHASTSSSAGACFLGHFTDAQFVLSDIANFWLALVASEEGFAALLWDTHSMGKVFRISSPICNCNSSINNDCVIGSSIFLLENG